MSLRAALGRWGMNGMGSPKLATEGMLSGGGCAMVEALEVVVVVVLVVGSAEPLSWIAGTSSWDAMMKYSR